MESFPRQLAPTTDLFDTPRTYDDAQNGRIRYAVTTAEQVAYPLPDEALGQAGWATVASLFVDFRTGMYQDVRQGNQMFTPVAFPKDDDPLLQII
jgi:hypothetical protein